MSTALELVYEYRALMGRRGGTGLSLDDIETVEAIEGLFAVDAVPLKPEGLVASLRGRAGKLWDRIGISSVGLDQVGVKVPAFLEPGALVELVVEDEELRLSYRFKGLVRSIHGDPSAPAHGVTIELVGVPLLVRRGPKVARPDARTMPPRPSSEPRVVAA
ncbi:MAG TPA: hypothetical protein VK698_34525 [Kofleriaceae bacterium]|jgi:hypothetical protein|nr:hypothetical protein [Kofleriaceae bacterium]